MRIHLAGCGWIDDTQPYGNRLRWSYPYDERVGRGAYRGLPDWLTVERAWLDEDLWTRPDVQTPRGTVTPSAQAIAPHSWWTPPINLQLSDWFVIYRLKSPVQAVRFTYRGPATQIRVKDVANNRLIVDRPIAHNDEFYLEAPLIEEISFIPLAPTVYLDGFSVLDMFQARGLQWETIARLAVADSLKQGTALVDVAARCGGQTKLSDAQWTELLDLVSQAQASAPAGPAKPVDLMAQPPVTEVEVVPPWQTLSMMLGLRWEFACLLGFGYLDGPGAGSGPLDEAEPGLVLGQTPDRPVAYRVRCDGERGMLSNIVVCPPYAAGALNPPAPPEYHNPMARLGQDGKIEATAEMEWQHMDARGVGVDVEEVVGASAAKGTGPQVTRFEGRPASPYDPPYTGRLSRRFEVPWHDVTLSASARALDAWDRASAPSAAGPALSLSLEHAPAPPPLSVAEYSQGAVRITRQAASREVPLWQPDAIVQAAQGKVAFYRRDLQKKLRTASVTIGPPLWMDEGLYRATIAAANPQAFNPHVFAGGAVLIGDMRLAIEEISGAEVRFRLPDDASASAPAYAPGSGTLYQDPMDLSLWVKVHEEQASGLPPVVTFIDPLPAPVGKGDVLSYHARVSFLGRLGPPSNVVADSRIPPPPSVPPPFTVELQGVDFYGRTMVKIRLTSPVGGGQYRVWWASGDWSQDPGSFAQKAVAGLQGPQDVQNGLFLYDVLPLPLARATQQPLQPLTIGVQAVNESGGQSKFEVVKL